MLGVVLFPADHHGSKPNRKSPGVWHPPGLSLYVNLALADFPGVAMSKDLSPIERHIAAEVAKAKTSPDTDRPTLLLSSRTLAFSCPLFDRDLSQRQWTPSAPQRQAILRGMHSFVRKYPNFALAGCQGRRGLYLYEPGDPLSALWAKMNVESRTVVPRSKAQIALETTGQPSAASSAQRLRARP
jgi:hypothetical protein